MTPNERHLLGGALLALGLSAAGLAGATVPLAARHMVGLAAFCGPQAPHCAWCLVAAASMAGALAALALGTRLTMAPVLLRVRR